MANKGFDWQTLKEGLMKREILIALTLLSAAIIMLIVSMLPAYDVYIKSGELDLPEPYDPYIHPPEEVMDNFHVSESNISLTSYNGNSLLDLYRDHQSNFTLLEKVYLQNSTERTVDLQSEAPILFVNITSTSANRLEYKYVVLGYRYPYLLLALPGSLLALIGIVLALMGTFIFVAEQAEHRKIEANSQKRKAIISWGVSSWLHFSRISSARHI